LCKSCASPNGLPATTPPWPLFPLFSPLGSRTCPALRICPRPTTSSAKWWPMSPPSGQRPVPSWSTPCSSRTRRG
jgi:hypothetical protein